VSLALEPEARCADLFVGALKMTGMKMTDHRNVQA